MVFFNPTPEQLLLIAVFAFVLIMVLALPEERPVNTPEKESDLGKTWTPWGAAHAAVIELFEAQTQGWNPTIRIALTPIAHFFGLIAAGFALAGIGTLALFAVLAYLRLTPSVWAKPPRERR